MIISKFIKWKKYLTEFLSFIFVILKSKQHNSIKLIIEKVTCTKFCVIAGFGSAEYENIVFTGWMKCQLYVNYY